MQPELLFVQKGGKNEVDDVSFKISYLEVSVLAKFRIPARRLDVPRSLLTAAFPAAL